MDAPIVKKTANDEKPPEKIQQLQSHLDEVTGIMRINVEKVLERDKKLSELDYRAAGLSQDALVFTEKATKLKKKNRCYYYCKCFMCIVGIVCIIIIIIVVSLFLSFEK